MSWEDVQDPEGRLTKGPARFIGQATRVVIIRLCAPSGLYHRPRRDSDPAWSTMLDQISCEAGDEGAVYDPTGLMAYFRYENGDETTIQACHLEMI